MVKTRREIPYAIALALSAMLAAGVPQAAVAASPSSGLLTPVVFQSSAAATDYVMSEPDSTVIAPGVTLSTYEVLNSQGWVNAHVLAVDLTNPWTTPNLLFPGDVADAQTVKEMAQAQGAVAAVNGDFFDIQGTKAPMSAAVASGSLVKGPAEGWPLVAGVGMDRLGRLAEMAVEGSLVFPDGSSYPITAVNQHLPEQSIGVFTSLWGPSSRYLTAKWGNGIKEVTVRNNVVVAVSDEAGSGQIPEDTVVLLGREGGAEALSKLKVGDRVSFQYSPKSSAGIPFWFALGGDEVLVSSGIISGSLENQSAAPRTAIGFSADGRTMYLVAVDGRQAASRGMTKYQLAEFMKGIGAASALNLDGGGSTTMVARLPGESEVSVVNSPSETRRVPNGVGLFVDQGSGQLKSINIRAETVAHGDRLFPGLIGRFEAQGQDESLAPAALRNPTWWIAEGDAAVLSDGMVQAGQTGTFRLAVADQGVEAAKEIQVLGDLYRIAVEPETMELDGTPQSFSVMGYDVDGYEAPIDAVNVDVDYDPTLVRVAANADGGFEVTPVALQGSAAITITVGDQQTVLPVSLGGKLTLVDDFEDLSRWEASAYPAVVGSSMTSAAGHSGQGLSLRYDFTTTDVTRAAYAEAIWGGIALPKGSTSLGLWVKGDGNGAWLRAVVADAQGTTFTINLAPHINWTGWQYVETDLPSGLLQPIYVRRIYPVETDGNSKYQGEIVLDDLMARAPAAVPSAPETVEQTDPMVVSADALSASGARFAVLSHRLLSATTAASWEGWELDSTLQQIAAAQPDFVVLAGDMVAEPDWSHLALLKELVVQELGRDVPVYYLQGEREIDRSGLVNQLFPRDANSFDLDRTRFMLLDSGDGSLRTTDFAQLVKLKQMLAEAAGDAQVQNVVVIAPHPLSDATGSGYQLTDQREAALVQEMLAEFRAASGGKGAAYIAGGPAGGVSVQRKEGVRNVTVGADSWALFSLLPSSGTEWLQVAEQGGR